MLVQTAPAPEAELAARTVVAEKGTTKAAGVAGIAVCG